MRKPALLALVLVILASGARAAEPVVANSWDEAVTLSKQLGTPILIDFFTEW